MKKRYFKLIFAAFLVLSITSGSGIGSEITTFGGKHDWDTR